MTNFEQWQTQLEHRLDQHEAELRDLLPRFDGTCVGEMLSSLEQLVKTDDLQIRVSALCSLVGLMHGIRSNCERAKAGGA